MILQWRTEIAGGIPFVYIRITREDDDAWCVGETETFIDSWEVSVSVNSSSALAYVGAAYEYDLPNEVIDLVYANVPRRFLDQLRALGSGRSVLFNLLWASRIERPASGGSFETMPAPTITIFNSDIHCPEPDVSTDSNWSRIIRAVAIAPEPSTDSRWSGIIRAVAIAPEPSTDSRWSGIIRAVAIAPEPSTDSDWSERISASAFDEPSTDSEWSDLQSAESFQANNPPTLAIPDQTYTLPVNESTIDLDNYISDPEGDSWTYEIDSLSGGLALFRLTGNRLRITTPRYVGPEWFVIEATDEHGASATQRVNVRVIRLPTGSDVEHDCYVIPRIQMVYNEERIFDTGPYYYFPAGGGATAGDNLEDVLIEPWSFNDDGNIDHVAIEYGGRTPTSNPQPLLLVQPPNGELDFPNVQITTGAFAPILLPRAIPKILDSSFIVNTREQGILIRAQNYTTVGNNGHYEFTTRYITDPNDSREICEIYVDVIGPPTTAPTVEIECDPDRTLVGNLTNISWSSQGAESVIVTVGNSSISSLPGGFSAGWRLSSNGQAVAGTLTARIEATNAVGTTVATATCIFGEVATDSAWSALVAAELFGISTDSAWSELVSSGSSDSEWSELVSPGSSDSEWSALVSVGSADSEWSELIEPDPFGPSADSEWSSLIEADPLDISTDSDWSRLLRAISFQVGTVRCEDISISIASTSLGIYSLNPSVIREDGEYSPNDVQIRNVSPGLNAIVDIVGSGFNADAYIDIAPPFVPGEYSLEFRVFSEELNLWTGWCVADITITPPPPTTDSNWSTLVQAEPYVEPSTDSEWSDLVHAEPYVDPSTDSEWSSLVQADDPSRDSEWSGLVAAEPFPLTTDSAWSKPTYTTNRTLDSEWSNATYAEGTTGDSYWTNPPAFSISERVLQQPINIEICNQNLPISIDLNNFLFGLWSDRTTVAVRLTATTGPIEIFWYSNSAERTIFIEEIEDLDPLTSIGSQEFALTIVDTGGEGTVVQMGTATINYVFCPTEDSAWSRAAAVVGDSLDSLWSEAAAGMADTLDSGWSLPVYVVGPTGDSEWAPASFAIGPSKDSKWSVSTFAVGDTADSPWSPTAYTAGQTLDGLWSLPAHVRPDTNDSLWVRTPAHAIGLTRDSEWSDAAIAPTRDSGWSDPAFGVGTTLDSVWSDSTHAIGSSFDSEWSLPAASVGSTRDSRWSPATTVAGPSLDSEWSLPTFTPPRARDSEWSEPAQTASETRDSLWSTPTASLTRDSLWSIPAFVSAGTDDSAWSLPAHTGPSTKDGEWSTAAHAQPGTADSLWSLAAFVSPERTRDSLWSRATIHTEEPELVTPQTPGTSAVFHLDFGIPLLRSTVAPILRKVEGWYDATRFFGNAGADIDRSIVITVRNPFFVDDTLTDGSLDVELMAFGHSGSDIPRGYDATIDEMLIRFRVGASPPQLIIIPNNATTTGGNRFPIPWENITDAGLETVDIVITPNPTKTGLDVMLVAGDAVDGMGNPITGRSTSFTLNNSSIYADVDTGSHWGIGFTVPGDEDGVRKSVGHQAVFRGDPNHDGVVLGFINDLFWYNHEAHEIYYGPRLLALTEHKATFFNGRDSTRSQTPPQVPHFQAMLFDDGNEMWERTIRNYTDDSKTRSELGAGVRVHAILVSPTTNYKLATGILQETTQEYDENLAWIKLVGNGSSSLLTASQVLSSKLWSPSKRLTVGDAIEEVHTAYLESVALNLIPHGLEEWLDPSFDKLQFRMRLNWWWTNFEAPWNVLYRLIATQGPPASWYENRFGKLIFKANALDSDLELTLGGRDNGVPDFPIVGKVSTVDYITDVINDAHVPIILRGWILPNDDALEMDQAAELASRIQSSVTPPLTTLAPPQRIWDNLIEQVNYALAQGNSIDAAAVAADWMSGQQIAAGETHRYRISSDSPLTNVNVIDMRSAIVPPTQQNDSEDAVGLPVDATIDGAAVVLRYYSATLLELAVTAPSGMAVEMPQLMVFASTLKNIDQLEYWAQPAVPDSLDEAITKESIRRYRYRLANYNGYPDIAPTDAQRMADWLVQYYRQPTRVYSMRIDLNDNLADLDKLVPLAKANIRIPKDDGSYIDRDDILLRSVELEFQDGLAFANITAEDLPTGLTMPAFGT